jgi:hypothetical protein
VHVGYNLAGPDKESAADNPRLSLRIVGQYSNDRRLDPPDEIRQRLALYDKLKFLALCVFGR